MGKKHDKTDPSQHRVTIYDIAEAIGVSHTTVSKALRNNPRISEATRVRVQEKAAAMNYRPDPMLSALSSYRMANREDKTQAALAWINPFRAPDLLRQTKEFDLYWQGAKETANRMGYQLEEFNTVDLSFPRMNTIFKTRNIQGLLLATLCGPDYEDPAINWQAFPWQDYAIVRFGRQNSYPEAHYITSAQTTVGILAFRSMRERGYQRIGFVGKYTRQRIFNAGVSFAQEELPPEQVIQRLHLSDADPVDLQMSALDHWIKSNRPDAILTDRPNLTELLKTMGYRIPEDLGLATTSIHDTPINAGIDQNPIDIGRAAVRTLISLITERTMGIPSVRNEIMIEGKWVDGSMLPNKQVSKHWK
ncbi:LacI family DNA-binding transcriptional regulator [Pontiellaceae bacterium B12219]|nr:LacI family DNA-binding transcriptional regulator [Pontiellaceae bacterium B12219]